MTQDLEDRLRRTLHHVADQVVADGDWERVSADAARQVSQPSTAAGHRPLFAVAAALLVLAAGGLAFWSGQPDERTTATTGVSFVLPGETVVDHQPLTVIPAPAPEPEFDTNDLGTEIRFEPLEAVDDEIAALIDRSAAGYPSELDVSLTKLVLVGQLGGDPWLVAIWDGPNVERLLGRSVDENVRYREVATAYGRYGTSDLIPLDSLDLVASSPPVPGWQLGGPGDENPEGWFTWGPLPTSTAVVSFVGSDRRLWMRPRAGVVAFPVRLDEQESFTVEALNASGQAVGRHDGHTGDTEGGARSGPQTGDTLGTLQGTAQTGEPLTIEPDGRLKALLFGADWCPPCQDIVPGVVEAIEGLDVEIDIYFVPHSTEDPWPAGAEWTYPQFVPEPASPLRAVSTLPELIMLDGENTVIFTFSGSDDIVAELAGLEFAVPADPSLDPGQAGLCAALQQNVDALQDEGDRTASLLEALEGERQGTDDPREIEALEQRLYEARGRQGVLAKRMAEVEREQEDTGC